MTAGRRDLETQEGVWPGKVFVVSRVMRICICGLVVVVVVYQDRRQRDAYMHNT